MCWIVYIKMGDMLEVLFLSDDDDNRLACTASDFRTGTNLMTYKSGGSIQQHSLCVLRTEYIIAANSSKPLLHVWPINGHELMSTVRLVVPGRVSAMALSPCCFFLVAGIQETLYIWHLSTGRLLNTISKHYQSISCVRFTDDGSHFVSAGKDGGVLVWNLTQVAARGDDNQTPLYSFNDHGLPVTDVHIGAGGMRAFLFTVSLDRTCRVYDLSNGTLLLNVVFAEGLNSVISNVLETCCYVGTCEGNIYELRLDSLPRTKEYHMEKEHTNRFVGHTAGKAVNCLALSLDEQTLVTGGDDKQVCIWHIHSRQLLKAMTLKGIVTNLVLRLTNSNIFHPEHKQPHIFCGNLRRMIDPVEADDELEIEVLITDLDAQGDDELIHTHKKTIAPAIHKPQAASVKDVHAAKEIEALRAEVARLKGINKQLFQVSAKHLLGAKK